MQPDPDHYEIYYQDKLWALIPSVYRTEDSAVLDQPGPLREIVNRLGVQAAVLRRSIDRTWEDQSIESCDDWVIPYIADLLATNLVAALDSRGQRLDVAKTIYYRRRKGTVAILEEIAVDITGWEARVVEFFRRLGRTRHGLDPPVGLPEGDTFPDQLQAAQWLVGMHTRTGIGGFADLRNRYGAAEAHGPFDEFFHFADFRRGVGQVGWYNIPRLGVFVWRLRAFRVEFGTPVAMQGCPDQYSFDPTGREIPLYALASRRQDQRFGSSWITPEEWQMPGAVDDGLFEAYGERLYPPAPPAGDPEPVRSIGVFHLPGIAGYELVDRGDVTIFLSIGRFRVANPPISTAVFVTYTYGFSSGIGAGPYDRRTALSIAAPLPALTNISGGGSASVSGSAGTATFLDSLTYTSVNDIANISDLMITSANEQRPVLRLAAGAEWSLTGAADSTLTLDGILISGGDIVLRGDYATVTLRSVTLDPGTSGIGGNLFATAVDGRSLTPTRLWIEGHVHDLIVYRSISGPIRTRNNGIVDTLSITDSILQGIRTSGFGPLVASDVKDPTRLAQRLGQGWEALSTQLVSNMPASLQTDLAAYDPASPPSVQLLDDIVTELNAVIAGPLLYTAALFEPFQLRPATEALLATNPSGADLAPLNRMLLEDAFANELADAVIALVDGAVRLNQVTVMGQLISGTIESSESILDGIAVVENTQAGCVRFSAWTSGSILPRKYESVRISAGAAIFDSRFYGRPEYGQLSAGSHRAIIEPVEGGSILEGAQDGSEMGAFSSEKNAIKERSLLIKYEEFMPLGLIPVVIHVT
jgi:hypothetical protein